MPGSTTIVCVCVYFFYPQKPQNYCIGTEYIVGINPDNHNITYPCLASIQSIILHEKLTVRKALVLSAIGLAHLNL